MIIVMLFDTY